LLIATVPVFAQKQTKDQFVKSLMDKMTLQEKLGQLNLIIPGDGSVTGSVVSTDVEGKIKKGLVGGMFGIAGLDKIKKVQEMVVRESRLHIPMLFGSDIIHGYKTAFPIPLALSASWDMPLIQKSAQMAALEATADGLNWTFSPMVDIARDPRWGRVAEGAGEDPYLGSAVAKAMVMGYQGGNGSTNLASGNSLLSCVKHFALYGAPEAGRDYNSVDMSKLKMYNDYFPPYKAAVDAGAGSVMSSFNDIDGVPASGNKWLLTDVLRKQWGFKGFVVSDYTSVTEMINHGMGDTAAVSALSLNAGLDMDMVSEGFLNTLQKSLLSGKVSMASINEACKRILEAKYDLGLFEDPYKYCKTARASEVLSADKRAFAKEAAMHSFVLLKNDNQVLPLRANQKIALIGPLANDKSNMLGTWSINANASASIGVFDGFKSRPGIGSKVMYAKGANLSDDPVFAAKINVFGEKISIDSRSPQELLAEALTVAAASDVIVAVVGEASEMSGEAASRSNLDIPASQQKLIEALAKTGKPLVLVLMNGRPLTIPNELKWATAVLDVWHAGTEAGNAIASVLYGDYNPSGKLTMSFPRNVGQVPIYYSIRNTGRPNGGDVFGKYRSNYLDVENSPLLPFGFGLSYTTFSYSKPVLSGTSVTVTKGITASVILTNTGNYDGEEVVQLYIKDEVGSITRPLKELKGFQKVFLKKGESKTVTFSIDEKMLRFYNADLKHVSEKGSFQVFIGTNSSIENSATFQLK
ncbi:MAG: beta-glucosidase BglX, partial [Bacteroidota bacterium]